jgi:hypothetical protein
MRASLALLLILPAWAATPNDFFEQRVRPVLANHCFGCHTKTALGGLRLDSREALLKGGKSGAAAIPGKASESLLIQAVEHRHAKLKMPPTEKLSAEQVDSLRQWIDAGLTWPETKTAAPSNSFWSLQPVRKPATSGGIDSLLQAERAKAGLKANLPADRRTLIRRLSFDLIGLPPTPEEITAFVNDRSLNANEKVVDRLLASPHYGERWARHWLDLARYSDGQQAAREDTPYPNAFRYRDWVIEAFNKDLPYDTFVKAQLAADQLNDTALLPALGFQTLGESNNDRVDVTTRVFLGLTVGCAQCHDHKYDPIPTKDYYSLLGVFQSSKPDEHALVSKEVADRYKTAKKAAATKQDELKQFIDKQVAQVTDILASQTSQYLMAARAVLLGRKPDTEGLDQATLDRWVAYLRRSERDHPFLKEWDALMKNGGGSDIEAQAAAQSLHASIQSLFAEKKAMEDRNYVKLGGLEGMKDAGKVIATLVEALPIEKYYFWRDLASRPYKVEDIQFPGGVYYYAPKDVERFLGAHWKGYLERLRAEAKELEKAVPPPYPFWHILTDAEKPKNAKLAIRGNASNLGEEVPRHFLTALSPTEPKPFTQGSGRLELANAIASPNNPLTARVMVNRLWKHHFGEGIVRSTSNFGQLGDRPTHPELLDYLAARFTERGWSVKALQKEIVMSAAYQMSSSEAGREDATAKDPDNKLLWRANVRERLDAEALRDSILATAGTLDRSLGGEPKPLTDDYRRRTVYATVSRGIPDRTMAMFDFPDPNSTSEQRLTTVGPMQRLYFMNSPFVAAQSKALAARLAAEAATDRARIERAYEIVYGRPANPEEIKLGLDFVSANPWPQYTQALFGAAEFSAVQ